MRGLGTAAYSYTPLHQSPPLCSASFKLFFFRKAISSVHIQHSEWMWCAYFVLYLSAIADLSAGSGMYFKCVVYSCGAIHNKMFTRRIEATLTRHPPFRNKFLKVMKINLGLKN